MKQIQLSHFDPARLLTYVLLRLVESHATELSARKSRTDTTDAREERLPRSPARAAEDILRTAEQRWPSRYY